MTDFAKDVDLRGNKLKRAKVDIPNRAAIADDDVIDKQYVDEFDVYTSDLTANVGLQPINDVLDRTLLHNKPTKEVFDNLFYPRILHSYEKPVHTIDVRYVNPGTTVLTAPTPGKLVDVILEVIVDFKDSAGLVSYEFSGNGITGTITQASVLYIIANYTILEAQNWSVNLNYLAANVANDSRGIVDNVGAIGALIFDAGDISVNEVNEFPVAHYIASILGNIPFPSANNVDALLSSGKFLNERPSEFATTILANDTYTTFIAFEIAGTVAPELTVIKDNAQSMTESFESTILYNVPFGPINKTFAVYRSVNGIGYSKNATYNIKVN